MTRKPLLIANWKLNHLKSDVVQFFGELQQDLPKLGLDIAIAPVAPLLDFAHGLAQAPVHIAAQNVFYEKSGAFTGEWSGEHLRELGVSYCIVGHSERRHLFFETDQDIKKKAQALIAQNIIPVICIGESLTEREDGQTLAKISSQIEAVSESLIGIDGGKFVIAYEPIWAIGTGKVPKVNEVQDSCKGIRDRLSALLKKTVAEQVRILYGGSVTAENIGEIVSLPDVDGALVGGASLQVKSFLSMVKTVNGLGKGP